MKRLLFFCFLGSSVCVLIAADTKPPAKHNAQPPARTAKKSVKVGAQGVTKLDAVFADARISVRIVTHIVDIGTSDDIKPKTAETRNCTESRFPCSPVDDMGISVDGKDIPIRGVFFDLADVNWARLRQLKNGTYLLTLECGDAAASYSARIIFDKDRIVQREFFDEEGQEVIERTIYFKQSSDL